MESKAEAFGHAIHPMLIPFPLGLLGTAGIVAGAQAGMVGAIDWAALPAGTRAKRVATQHGLGNLGVLLLFATAWVAAPRAAGGAVGRRARAGAARPRRGDGHRLAGR